MVFKSGYEMWFIKLDTFTGSRGSDVDRDDEWWAFFLRFFWGGRGG